MDMHTSYIFSISKLLHSESGTQDDFDVAVADHDPLEGGELIEPVSAHLALVRLPDGVLAVLTDIATRAKLTCARCLTPFERAITIARAEQEYVVHETREALEAYEDAEGRIIVGIDAKHQTLSIQPLMYEELFLALVAVPYCRDDCKGLCPECGTNWNEHSCPHEGNTAPSEVPIESKKLSQIKELYEQHQQRTE